MGVDVPEYVSTRRPATAREGAHVTRDSSSHPDPDDSISAIHHILRSSRRRIAVQIIADRPHREFKTDHNVDSVDEEAEIAVRTIAREIVSIEQGIPTQQATGSQYHNVYTSLIQSHLARLDAVEAIRYDPDRKTIKPGKNLLAIAAIAAATTPLAHLLFHSNTAELFSGGSGGGGDSITD